MHEHQYQPGKMMNNVASEVVFPPIPGIFGEPPPKSGAGIPGTEGWDRGA